MTSQKLTQHFTETLVQEVAWQGTFFGPKVPIETIYLGGGTPSLLQISQIATILESVHQHFDTSNVLECTLEINPDDVDLSYLKSLRSLGIDRLSIGIQSFFEEDLQWMNRAHTAEQAQAIVDMARAAGFDRFSVDLIFGLPEQFEERWHANLDKALALDIPHLSTYGLTIEPQTPLYRQVELGRQTPISEHKSAGIYQHTMDKLRAAGYEHYEISSFCKPGERSQHNQRYWLHDNYLGLGPSAHSFWQSENRPASRWANVRNLKKYISWDGDENPPLDFQEHIEPLQLANEYIMLRLRTRDGLQLSTLSEKYGLDIHPAKVEHIVNNGMARLDASGVLSLTDQGLLLCDTITESLMSAG